VPLKYITKRCLALDCWTEAEQTIRKLSGLEGINFSSVARMRLPSYPSAGTGRKSMRPVEGVEYSLKKRERVSWWGRERLRLACSPLHRDRYADAGVRFAPRLHKGTFPEKECRWC
jgi:hypothetical protein